MPQTGVVSLTPYAYPNGKNDTQLRQEISGTLGIAGPATVGTFGPITAWAIATDVLTFTAVNTLTTGGGQQITVSGFATSTFLNGNYTVVSATGTTIVVAITHADGGATEAGKFALTPQYLTNGLPINWIPMTSGIIETTQAKPCTGSVRFTSQAGSDFAYQYDPVHNTLRIVLMGTGELATTAAITADTIGFVAEFLKDG